MDRSLDEILAERKQSNRGSRSTRGGGGGGNGGRRRERQDYPRDGVRKVTSSPVPPLRQNHPSSSVDSTGQDMVGASRLNPRLSPHEASERDRRKKSFRDDAPRSLDSEWVHDKFDDNAGGRRSAGPRRRQSPEATESRGSKIRVENIHYELTEDDLDGLFNKIGPVAKLELRYDRAGRSEGTAFVTYESHQDAVQAIKEYDGANAAGQPIRLSLMPAGSGPRRGGVDNAGGSARSLADRVTFQPSNRSRSLSPGRDVRDNVGRRSGVDSYRPEGGGSRSRSPMPGRRRDGRRPGARRERGGRNEGAGTQRGQGRTKKTAEELDAEMADYFGGGGGGAGGGEGTQGKAGETAGAPQDTMEVDMIS